jgi:hypothetical protein
VGRGLPSETLAHGASAAVPSRGTKDSRGMAPAATNIHHTANTNHVTYIFQFANRLPVLLKKEKKTS